MNKLLEGSKVINIIDNSDDINYHLDNDNSLVLNIFCHEIKDININVDVINNNKLIINYSGLSYQDNQIKINVNVKGDNNKIIVNGRFISINHTCTVNVDTFVKKQSKDNLIEENLKGINEEGMVILNPILRIDTNEVNASHGASVGKYDKNVVFYLKSKGLEDKIVKDILKKSFLYSLFSDNFIKMIQEGDGENE